VIWMVCWDGRRLVRRTLGVGRAPSSTASKLGTIALSASASAPVRTNAGSRDRHGRDGRLSRIQGLLGRQGRGCAVSAVILRGIRSSSQRIGEEIALALKKVATRRRGGLILDPFLPLPCFLSARSMTARSISTCAATRQRLCEARRRISCRRVRSAVRAARRGQIHAVERQ